MITKDELVRLKNAVASLVMGDMVNSLAEDDIAEYDEAICACRDYKDMVEAELDRLRRALSKAESYEYIAAKIRNE